MTSSSARTSTSSLRWLCFALVVCICARSSQGFTRYCGSKLTEVLALVCPNGFAPKLKKSINYMEDYSESGGELSAALSDWPFLSRVASNELAKTRRRRFGIVDECCARHCTKSQILAYCN